MVAFLLIIRKMEVVVEATEGRQGGPVPELDDCDLLAAARLPQDQR